jgi:hypothetical protein
VKLNGELIHDLNLHEQTQTVKRHDGSIAPQVKDRPPRGHIGFQELSRDGDQVQIRGARFSCSIEKHHRGVSWGSKKSNDQQSVPFPGCVRA